MIGMHVIWVCRILCFISWIHLCDSQEKKINGIPTENKDNMISSIAKMSEGGRPKNKWQVKICKSCQKGRLGFFFYFKRIGDTISCSGLPHFKTLMFGTIFWVQVRLIGLSFLDHPQILQSILSQKLISCLSSGLPFFQCSSLDLVPSTT